MKHILVPVDFSHNSYNALFHAARLMQGKPCTFHILNVYNGFTPLQAKNVGKELSEQLEDESIEGLRNFCHRIRLDEANSEHTFKTISKRGNLVDEISKIVEHEKIDLIIMGNSGRTEIEAIFMGSNALDVTSKIKQCAVLTIPKAINFASPNEIAFVTDYQQPYDAGLLRPLLFIAKRHKSKIRVMHINEEEVLNKHQMMNKSVLLEYLLPFEHSFHWMPLFKSKATAIDTFLDELDIDMLAMVNYEHSFLDRMTREPVIKRVGFDNKIPFLVIPYTN
ncbi:universal stress protein [Maribacter algicola]|uniref:Universal stress protein n=1 Tax=Meishania litoralis TaxID=3434685 RepID=A0ACC7LHP3_9FLAO